MDSFGGQFWWTVLVDSVGRYFWWTVLVDSFGGQFWWTVLVDSFDTFAIDTGLHQLLIFHVDRDFMLTGLVTEYKTIPVPFFPYYFGEEKKKNKKKSEKIRIEKVQTGRNYI